MRTLWKWRPVLPTIVTILGLSLVAGVASYVPEAQAKPLNRPAPAIQKEKSTPGKNFVPKARKESKQSAAAVTPPPAPEWPAASHSLADTAGLTRGLLRKVGNSPISVGTPAAAKVAGPVPAVNVDVLGQSESERLGVAGVIMRLARQDLLPSPAKLTVKVDYSKFASAYGGDWSSRLRLVELSCSAPTGCVEQRVLPAGHNDTRSKTVTAEVDVPAQAVAPRTVGARSAERYTTMALTAGASGPAGSYAATPLAPSSVWNVSAQTGDFSWSYPLRVPPGTVGPRPDLAISYSSGSVDGQVASTNNQTSWVGQGHSLEPGFIERKYVSCADDVEGSNTTVKTGDLCWKSDNAFVSLAGHSGELVKLADGTFKFEDDDGTRIQRLSGATNGAQGGEYWLLTTADGTQYYFGLNPLVSTTNRSNSVSTVPVFGNHVGEPCRKDTFAASYCTQAWRWNVDRVIDVNGNQMSYRYVQESNYYGRNNNTGVSVYQRASYPYMVEYGQVGNRATPAVAPSSTPARVWFGVAERCLPGGTVTCDPAQLTAANASKWPDVPFDQLCTSSASCPNRTSPSFFTRKRLATVNTEILKGTAFSPVDTWTFVQAYPPADVNPSLFLRSITHQGRAGGALTNPSVTFKEISKPNRVDAIGDGAPEMFKDRISEISSESGQNTTVNYSNAQCTPTSKPVHVATNAMRCFPVYWTIDGGPSPTLHWFNKFVVNNVVVHDSVTDAPDQVTAYQYLGAPAWHFDDNELTLLKYRSWSDWRGYSKVDVKVGSTSDQSRTQYTFFRGMHGDYLDREGSTRKSVVVTDSQGDSMADAGRLNGSIREQITFNGAAGPEVSGRIDTPWTKQTGSAGGAVAMLRQTKSSFTRTRLSNGSYRTVGTSTDFDDLGMPVAVHEHGDITVATDDRCTRYTYNRNGALGLTNAVSREEQLSVGCAATPSRPQQVISDERTYFDGHPALNTPPVEGLVTKVETMSGWSNGPVYEQRSRTAYDALGRVRETYDGLNRRTGEVIYTPATGGPVTAKSVKDAKGFVSTTLIDPAWGATVAEVDPNMRRTDLAYDAFGRLTGVWLPNRPKANGATASVLFSYLVSKTVPNVVATQELLPNGAYKTSRTLFDGLLRQRQVQTPAATGTGRVIADTTYDFRGNVGTSAGPYFESSSAPSNNLYDVAEGNLPAQTVNTYDGANRNVLSVFKVQSSEQWRTQTIYGGNATAVIPPGGATTTMQLTDARGKLTELRQYHGAAAGGAFDSTKYTYTADDQLELVTNARGSVWRYAYDLRGRQITADDPDKGVTRSAYDAADRLVSTTDASNRSLFYSYDELDRKTATRTGSAAGPVISSWIYDTLGKGLLTSSTRTVGGNNYVSAITAYDSMDRPTGTQVVIPASEGKLAGTYKSTTAYNSDGTVRNAKLPTTPGLPDETVNLTYDGSGNLIRMGGWQAYVSGTKYGEYGDPLQYAMGQQSDKLLFQSFAYEEGTRRLAQMRVDRNAVAVPDDVFDYGYDDASNVTSIAHTLGAVTDRQCFAHDYLRRTTQAWTPAGTCAPAPSAASLGGPAPYWQSYNFDAAGNRTSLVDHKVVGNTTSTYAYPAATARRPHAVTGVSSAGPAGTSADTYAYDESGNLSSRTVGGDADTFSWDAEGHLSAVSGPGGDTSYIYDAEGSRLIRKDPKGSTLYLASAEVRWDKAADTVSSTRYYDFNGATVAMRNNIQSVEYLMADQQGTASVSFDGITGALSRRYMDPFGNARGTRSPTWEPNSHGFVNGVDDASTGLTHLGAREYDSKLGRFISVDPLLDVTNPTSLNGYRYGNNNPATYSDPTGLKDFLEEPDDTRPTIGPPPPTPPPPTPAQVKEKAQKQVVAEITKHREAKEEAKRVIKKVIKDLVKIVADELGVTDALNCFKDGDLGACVATGVTILSSFAGGIAGKLLSKYLFHAKKAWKLIGRIKNLIGEAIDGIKGFRKAERELDAASCAINSFVPGTLVLLADGSRKPIEKLTTKDRVIATDPKSGKSGAKSVVRTIIGQGLKDLVDIEIAVIAVDGSRETVEVTATAGHPFYVSVLKQWLKASELHAGMFLQGFEGNVEATVLGVQSRRAQATVYNLTVDEIHTYYVTAGRARAHILVHNCGSQIYEAGGKHGPAVRDTSRGLNSAEPSAGQAALDNSVQIKSTSPRRVGRSEGQTVVLDRTEVRGCGCTVPGGTNEIFHGHVRGDFQTAPSMAKARVVLNKAIKSGLVSN